MKGIVIRQGAIMKFDYEHDGVIEEGHEFVLADVYDSECIFQIICVKGYHKGNLEVYILREKDNISNKITYEYLVKELNRTFINILWETFLIIN
jgi:hypothetical protein